LPQYRKTIEKPFTLCGEGIHSGKYCEVTVNPGKTSQGINFYRKDVVSGNNCVHADMKSIQADKLLRRTTLSNGDGVSVCTVEHILSALYAFGVYDAEIEVTAEEMPILDGSAKRIANEIAKSGIMTTDTEIIPLKLDVPFTYECGDSEFSVLPSDDFTITYIYRSKWRGNNTLFITLNMDLDSFVNEVAPARTFCFYSDIETAWKMGLSLGGSLNNAVVIGRKSIISSEPLRFDNEPVRHKVLDFVGDMSLIGLPITGRYTIVNGGHNANAQFANKLFEVCAK